MSESFESVESQEYRIILIDGMSKAVMLLVERGGATFPTVSIPKHTRPAEELRKAIHRAWGLHALILDLLWPGEDPQHTAIAELLTDGTGDRLFTCFQLAQLPTSILPKSVLDYLNETINGAPAGRFSRLGWIDELLQWMEEVTGHRLSSREGIEQLNGCGAFALLRLPVDDKQAYWFKATGEPNAHEFGITRYLSKYFPDALPPLIAVQSDWNGWLTEEVGACLPDQPGEAPLTRAARDLALLQLGTTTHAHVLCTYGAFDLRISKLTQSIDPIMEYLAGAMSRQQTTKVAPLSLRELQELATFLWEACDCMQSLGIPDTLIHNDLSYGNILDDGSQCVFTDWSEASVGNPFLSCERLCQLNQTHSQSIRTVYREVWSQYTYATVIDKAFALMPIVAIYAYLFGRGDWLESNSHSLRFESYARSLARHMYRATKSPALREALCH